MSDEAPEQPDVYSSSAVICYRAPQERNEERFRYSGAAS
jgi:hypothetical protein